MTFTTINPRFIRSLSVPFQELTKEVDEILGRVLSRDGNNPGAQTHTSGTIAYPVDVFESAEALTVVVDLPGFEKEQVDVTFDRQTLTITAERQAAAAVEGQPVQFLLQERRFGKFTRSLTLPDSIDESSVSARLEAGVLHITLSKKQEAKPRKVAVL